VLFWGRRNLSPVAVRAGVWGLVKNAGRTGLRIGLADNRDAGRICNVSEVKGENGNGKKQLKKGNGKLGSGKIGQRDTRVSVVVTFLLHWLHCLPLPILCCRNFRLLFFPRLHRCYLLLCPIFSLPNFPVDLSAFAHFSHCPIYRAHFSVCRIFRCTFFSCLFSIAIFTVNHK